MSLHHEAKLLDEITELIARVEAHRGDLSYQCEIRLAWPQVVDKFMQSRMPDAPVNYDAMPYPAVVGIESGLNTMLAENHRIRAKLAHRRVVAAWDAFVLPEETMARTELAAIEANLVKRGVRQPAAA